MPNCLGNGDARVEVTAGSGPTDGDGQHDTDRVRGADGEQGCGGMSATIDLGRVLVGSHPMPASEARLPMLNAAVAPTPQYT